MELLGEGGYAKVLKAVRLRQEDTSPNGTPQEIEEAKREREEEEGVGEPRGVEAAVLEEVTLRALGAVRE